jgi:hypothetical protein
MVRNESELESELTILKNSVFEYNAQLLIRFSSRFSGAKHLECITKLIEICFTQMENLVNMPIVFFIVI